MKTIKSEEVITESLQFVDKVFRGSLIIQASEVVQWKLYFRLGRLSWVTGGENSQERLRRHLAFFCPQISSQELQQISAKYQSESEQKILVHLQGQGLIKRNQMADLMTSIATEVLFDAIQYGEINDCNLSCHQVAETQNNNLLLLLPFLDINNVLIQAKTKWHQWQDAGLKKYSPNYYPILKNTNILNTLSDQPQKKLILQSLKGNQTLREIAAQTKQDILEITRFLVSLLDSEIVAFSPKPSNPREKKSSTTNKNNLVKQFAQPSVTEAKRFRDSLTTANKQKTSLIVCVDDSPLICQAVKEIVLKKNYRFLGIQEPIKVIPTLLRNKPDLIFLDLMMPIINGYELCAQLRKTPSLKDVPIIIVTGKDGLIDRMRAKLVGSTDFMSKPVEALSVLKMLEKYLLVN